jgi:Tfp pilus assembly PilM family ATPase
LFKKKTTTISFDGNEIRFLVVRGDKVSAWQSREIPEEHMRQGQVLTPKFVGNVIKTALRDIKGSRKNVISCMPGVRSVHRILKIPNIPDQLLAETVERKARQEFAIPIEESDISWQIISREQDQIILYAVAIQKALIDSQVEALQEAKIKSRIMDIKPLALMRLTQEKNALVVNLESHAMELIIVADHVPILIRALPLESADLTGEAKVDLLGQELARTAKYYNESYKHNPLPADTPLYISGALFASTNLETRLDATQSLIDRFQSRTTYPLQRPKTDLDLPEKFPLLRYAVNLGLGIKNQK